MSHATMLFHDAKLKPKKKKTHTYLEELSERHEQLVLIVKARSTTYVQEVLAEVAQRVKKMTTDRMKDSRQNCKTGCGKW